MDAHAQEGPARGGSHPGSLPTGIARGVGPDHAPPTSPETSGLKLGADGGHLSTLQPNFCSQGVLL